MAWQGIVSNYHDYINVGSECEGAQSSDLIREVLANATVYLHGMKRILHGDDYAADKHVSRQDIQTKLASIARGSRVGR